MRLPHKCLTYTNYPNDQLQFSLLEMGQVEILGRDRKRSEEKERGQERSISIGTKQHDNNSEQAQQNCVVCIEQNMHSRINKTHTTTTRT